jgi:branched-chain amino acid transport system ATP-binding protein
VTATDARPVPAPTGEAVLVAEHVGKRFEGIAALVDVSVHLAPGELVALIGPNGAGKSTLFGCLSGHIRPDSGRVTMNGHELSGLAPYERARLGLARTFQRIELFGGLSVRDHLLVAGRAHRGGSKLWRDLIGRSKPSTDEQARCDEMLELVGLTRVAERPAASLTLGTGRLVELARALMCDPIVLFLDEPSSGLDHRETDEMSSVLEHVAAQHGTAILLCEHDVAFVQRLASRAYVLDCGELIAEGPMSSVLADPAVRTAYLGQEGTKT